MDLWIQYYTCIIESPFHCKEIQPVHSKEDQSWVFFGRNDAKAETPVLWPSHAKSWLTGKDSDAGRDWGQEEKETTEDEMAGWHHWLDGHEFGWTPGVGNGQGGLACYNSWGRKESDTTWATELNWTEYQKKKEKNRGTIWHNNGWEYSKINDRHKTTDLGDPRTPRRINTKATPGHIILKLHKTKPKEKTWEEARPKVWRDLEEKGMWETLPTEEKR